MASGRADSHRPADAPDSVSPLELVVFGALCYILGLISGAILIPWLVDPGLFPVRRHGPCE
jgi:hypothetical protein